MFSDKLDLTTIGTLDEIYEMLYNLFKRDFIDNDTHLASSIYVNPNFGTPIDGKEEIFWHVVTRKNPSTRLREFDNNRASRIEWIKKAIENHTHGEIKLFYFYENNRKIKLYLWVHNHDFLVILQKLGSTESYIVSSFYIDNDRKRDKTQKKYDDYIAKSDSRLNNCEWF